MYYIDLMVRECCISLRPSSITFPEKLVYKNGMMRKKARLT